jgi:hypothetical protein
VEWCKWIREDKQKGNLRFINLWMIGGKARLEDTDHGVIPAAGVDSGNIQEDNQGSSNRGDTWINDSRKGMKGGDQSLEVLAGKPVDLVFCHRCKVVGHYTKECRRVWMGDREESQGAGQTGADGNLADLVAPLCATQAEGQAFFCIPNRPSQNNSMERATTAIVTVLKG